MFSQVFNFVKIETNFQNIAIQRRKQEINATKAYRNLVRTEKQKEN